MRRPPGRFEAIPDNLTAQEIADAAGIHKNTLFYNVKLLKEILGGLNLD